MAKKNQKDTSGVVFDTRSKMVMSQGGPPERMKEKISAVRAVVPNKSNNEIVLVLQHFENCVDKAVQAFLEGSAAEILKEWSVTGKKKPNKKKKPKPQPEAAAEPGPSEAAPLEEGKDKTNGFHPNGSLVEGESLDSLSEHLDSASLDASELDSELTASEITGAEVERVPSSQPVHSSYRGPRGNKARDSQHHNSSSALPDGQSRQRSSAGKKIAPNIDRSVKDLQRCTASLTRYRMLVKEEMESSLKTMKQTFAELQSTLMDREVTLLAEMDKVKAEAMGILNARQKRAEELRRLTDQSASMSEEQLTELRADIKHFVSERKYDEDLGKAVRFTFELEPLKTSITQFGSVYHPRTAYSDRSRCSSTSSSVASPSIVETPPPTQPQSPPSQFRPPPAKQIFQGKRRTFQGQGYQSGGQRYNSGYNSGSNHDRKPGRPDYRYRDGGCPSNSFRGAPHATAASSSSSPSSSSASNQKPASHNGLPQRPPRMACP